MRIIIAPDSYKGCLSAREVSGAMAAAFRALHPDWEIIELPLADGGDGTLDVVLPALRGECREANVHDPLGRTVCARWGLAGETAVIEVAEACGLKHLTPAERNPLVASTYGVGELLLAAREAGARHFLIGLGGTATCDGGRGMLAVSGLREALQGCTLELLCDVENPFIGPQGAAYVFAPQKGASEADVQVLEQRMTEWAGTILEQTGVDVRNMPGAGAAGGLGGAFMAYFGAARVSGIDRILELLCFEKVIKGAGLIVTGEGKSDLQTLSGKVAQGVLRHAQGIPVALVSGRIENREQLQEAGFSALVQVSPENMPLSEALKPETARANLAAAIGEWRSCSRG
ncbi:MAG: glycerate kinase [Bacteroidales bacterium]|nr:glycerate kinase [Bacteroidales bacterium]